MRVYKSEGVRGNRETYPHSRERYRGQQGQPEREPKAPHKTAVKLGKVVTRVVTDLRSGWKRNHTRVSEADFIGEQNRRSYKTGLSDRAYPLPPVPTAADVVPRKNIFPEKGKSNASTY